MRRKNIWRKLFTCTVLIALFNVHGFSQQDSTYESSSMGDEKLVYQFEITEEIFAPAWRKFKRAMDEADSLNADVILMKLDTYGGAVDVADDMRSRLLSTDKLTLVYIINNAASAGALISIACDSIYMNKEATIGAATVVDQSGQKAPDKYQSYFRGKFRATAEKKGRDPEIAEAMVDEDIAIPGIIDSGKILTFTTTEALKYDFCDGEVSSVEEVLEMAQIDNYQIVKFESNWVDNVIRFFTRPVVSGLLLTIIFFGIFFELQTPGVGFPIVAAITAAVFYFLPLYLDGLAANWEIIAFIVGLILIGIEIFVLPGFGITGIAGIVLIFSSLVLSLVRNFEGFNFTLTSTDELVQSIVVVLGSVIVTVILGSLIGRRFQTNPLTSKLVFKGTTDSAEGYDVDVYRNQDLLNKTGHTVTALRPSGKVEIEGERYDAHSDGEYIEKGEAITVIKAKGTSLIVVKVAPTT